jgi:uncharacterized protein YbjQ (UPF0145 family)
MSPWFKRRGGDQPGGPSREELAEQAAVAAQRSQDSLAEIEAGGLPLGAQERLKEIAAGGGAGVFSSDLSVQEYSLLTGLGVKPVTQVMGSSIYRVGWQPIVYNVPTEVTVLSGAFNECRRLALGRLAQEAQLAAADAVVGVRVERGSHDWAAGAIEFIAVGTAVRLPAAMRHPAGETVLTDLSGQQFVQLCRAGVRPVGIAGHTSVRYVPATWATPWPMTRAAPRECRRPAAQRLQQNRAGLFTSDLSVNEFLLVRQAGFRPLGLVIGSRSTTSATSRRSGSRARR